MNMRYTPKVSVVIPAYNASNYLEEAINSALDQTYSNIEIIVVNDGSKDNGATKAVVEKYGSKVRYFEKENGGSSSALNMGIRNMTGEWFSWLSHDDLYCADKVEKQISFMNMLGLPKEELKKNVFFAASELIDAKGNVIRTPKTAIMKSKADKVNAVLGNQYLIAEHTENFFHGCTCLIHRYVFETLGGFDEELRLLNDFDLWFRIYAAGYKVHFLPEVLVKGRIHGRQVSKSIGFSYHNSEQDMFWERSFEWLKLHYPNNYELFLKFGKNAYLKTRTLEGNKAFDIVLALRPDMKTELFLKKIIYRIYAGIRTFGKKIYLMVR